jgi:GntR family transcriptional regulator
MTTDGWTIDPDDPVPLGDQIVYRVLYSIARDVYQAGDRVPTVRDVATRLRVNPNTVSKAYRDLERDGVLVSRRGAGVFVSEGGPALARERRQALVLDRFERAVRDALDAGLSPVEIEDVLAQALVTAARNRRHAAPAPGKPLLTDLGDPGDPDSGADPSPSAARPGPIHEEEV